MMNEDKTHFTIQRDTKTQFRFSTTNFKGRQSFDIRQYYSEDLGVTWKPSTKGVRIGEREWADFVRGVSALSLTIGAK
jgi:hypothetical protein